MKQVDAIIVGGGLAGLTAATLLGRAGKRVVLFEKSGEIGGRARTAVEKGFQMNLGPHALYKGGEAFRILTELSIPFSGKSPSAAYSYTLHESKLQRLPYALFNRELLNFYRRINRIDSRDLENVPLDVWLDDEIRDESARRLIKMLIRVSTYCNDGARLSAGSAIEQLRLAITKGVLYLDHGWQVLVKGLTSAAQKTGSQLVSHRRVVAIEFSDSVQGVHLQDGQFIEGKNVILAVDPEESLQLMGKVFSSINRLVPVKMAALTLGLKNLPVKKRRAVFDLDRPLYLSVHSASAKLSDRPGEALIHLGKYLKPGRESDARKDRTELEEMMDLCQPGWRDEVLVSNFLPSITVTNTLVTADMHGKDGRPQVTVPEVKGLFLIGDWVGSRGMLSDASFASAEEVAQKILVLDSSTRCVA